jgi:hypothetical protein
MKSEEPEDPAKRTRKEIQELLERLLEHERQKLQEYDDFLREWEKNRSSSPPGPAD